MAYDKKWGYDPEMDYSSALLQQGLSPSERARLTAERQAKIKGAYGGAEPEYENTGSTFSQLYGTASMLPTPGSFNAESAAGAKPVFSSAYTQDVADLWGAVKNYGSFDYSNKNLYQQALDKVVNRPDFSYDAAADPLYGQYRKEYTREGNRAMEDTLGAAAAMSGGRASSWANTAAAQARNYYAAQMTDKIPELYQLALQKYLAEAQLDQSGLGAMQADRSAEQSEWRGNYDVLANKAGMAQSLENTDYSRYLDELGQWNADRSFNYGQLLDEIANQQALEQQGYERQRTAELDALDKAVREAALTGEYNGQPTLAARQDELERRRQELLDSQNWAKTAASLGSYGELDALGADTAYLRALQKAELDTLDQKRYWGYGADGESYGIGSDKGAAFVQNALPGQTMTGGDGSAWTKNADGSVTITDTAGRSYTVAAPAAEAAAPKLTASQALSAYEKGYRTEDVVYAMQYYYGVGGGTYYPAASAVSAGSRSAGGGKSGTVSSQKAETAAEETAGKWDAVEDWVRRYGADSAASYIKEHYKELGYSNQSTALAGWENHLTETRTAAQGGNPNGYVPVADLNRESNGSGKGLTVDVNSVLGLGYGPISEERLNALVESGQVQEYTEDGKLRFRNAGAGHNWTAYR